MTRRRVAALMLLAVLALCVCVPTGRALLWAQEGALGVQEDQEAGEQTAPDAPPTSEPASEPTVEYTGEPVAPAPSGRNWSNMNWYALYFVIAGPTAFFVFKGISR